MMTIWSLTVEWYEVAAIALYLLGMWGFSSKARVEHLKGPKRWALTILYTLFWLPVSLYICSANILKTLVKKGREKRKTYDEWKRIEYKAFDDRITRLKLALELVLDDMPESERVFYAKRCLKGEDDDEDDGE